MKLDNIEKIIIPKIEDEGFEIEYVEFVKEGDVKLYKKLDDKKEITGILKSVNDNNIVIESLEKEYIFNIKDIAVAHTIYDFDNAFKNKDNVNINKLKKF